MMTMVAGRISKRVMATALLASVALPAFAQEGTAQPSGKKADTTELQTITVDGKTQKDTRGYQPVSTSTATRSDTPLLNIPQAVNVVSNPVLTDQAATRWMMHLPM